MFHLFCGYRYSPYKSMDNYVGSYPSMDAAMQKAETVHKDWFQIAVVQEDQLVVAQKGETEDVRFY